MTANIDNKTFDCDYNKAFLKRLSSEESTTLVMQKVTSFDLGRTIRHVSPLKAKCLSVIWQSFKDFITHLCNHKYSAHVNSSFLSEKTLM